MEGVSLPSACVHVLGRVCQIDDDDDCVCVCVRACVRACVCFGKKGLLKKMEPVCCTAMYKCVCCVLGHVNKRGDMCVCVCVREREREVGV